MISKYVRHLLCPLHLLQLHETVKVLNILYYSYQQPNEEASIHTKCNYNYHLFHRLIYHSYYDLYLHCSLCLLQLHAIVIALYMQQYSSKQQYEEVNYHTKGIIIIIMIIMSLASIIHIYVYIHNNIRMTIDSQQRQEEVNYIMNKY